MRARLRSSDFEECVRWGAAEGARMAACKMHAIPPWTRRSIYCVDLRYCTVATVVAKPWLLATVATVATTTTYFSNIGTLLNKALKVF